VAERVTGVIRLEPPPENLAGAEIRVRVIDTTQADAASRETALTTLRDVDRASVKSGIPFAIDVPEIDPRNRYEVSVHVDMNRSGNIEAGDYLTMESYPVFTSGRGDKASVTARRVE
jgi:uncharacterized lipoprotein YbaY